MRLCPSSVCLPIHCLWLLVCWVNRAPVSAPIRTYSESVQHRTRVCTPVLSSPVQSCFVQSSSVLPAVRPEPSSSPVAWADRLPSHNPVRPRYVRRPPPAHGAASQCLPVPASAVPVPRSVCVRCLRREPCSRARPQRTAAPAPAAGAAGAAGCCESPHCARAAVALLHPLYCFCLCWAISPS